MDFLPGTLGLPSEVWSKLGGSGMTFMSRFQKIHCISSCKLHLLKKPQAIRFKERRHIPLPLDGRRMKESVVIFLKGHRSIRFRWNLKSNKLFISPYSEDQVFSPLAHRYLTYPYILGSRECQLIFFPVIFFLFPSFSKYIQSNIKTISSMFNWWQVSLPRIEVLPRELYIALVWYYKPLGRTGTTTLI